MKKFVCYTCCTGGYDDILQYDVLNPEWDYVFFTDNEQLIERKHVGQWEIRPLVFDKQTNVKNARYHKINAHILFPNYEASLWLDANLIIKSKNVLNKINELINSNAVISVPLHPERTCIYSEAEKIIELRIDYPNIVNTEMEMLKNENYPTNNGLHETCIVFRKHNMMKAALDLWWDMVDKHSKRDQLSFDYAMWKNEIEVVPFYPKGTDHHDNGDFLFRSGKNHNQNKIPEPFKIFKKIRKPNGKRQIYLFGKKIFSYKRKLKNPEYDKIYAKRFYGLTKEEIKYVLEVQFERMVGYKLNLDNPQSFNEKIQWLKLYYRNPLMTKCADKVGVRDYVKEKIGEEYLVPIIGVYKTPDEIDFDTLPNKFVMKVNWGSGQNIIVTDKKKLNIKQARQKLANWMKFENNHYFNFLEWVYKDIEPKIIIEEFLEQNNSYVYDYKFFCFNGSPKVMYVAVDSYNYSIMRVNYYDVDFNKLDLIKHYPNTDTPIRRPKYWDKMVELSKVLSQDFPFVRVDFFDTGEKLCVGELTFYPGNGTDPFEPIEWDYRLGKELILPTIE